MITDSIKGERPDFGIAFESFMAVAAGLASKAQAKSIYDRVDGKRIIESDASTGEATYHIATQSQLTP